MSLQVQSQLSLSINHHCGTKTVHRKSFNNCVHFTMCRYAKKCLGYMHREDSNYSGCILLLPEAGSYKPAHSHQLPGFLLPPNVSLRTLRLTGGPSHCCAYAGLCSLGPLLCSVRVVSVLISYNLIRNTRSSFSNRSTYIFMIVYVCACVCMLGGCLGGGKRYEILWSWSYRPSEHLTWVQE